jgi:NADH-quinone oxidoreductase E subunit
MPRIRKLEVSTAPAVDIGPILERFPHAKRDALIPILQEVQESHGFISHDTIVRVAAHLNLPPSKVYGVATFYNQFRFQAPGRFHVQLCRGTACHVKGSAALLEAVKRHLKLEAGQTTPYGLFSLEVVACIGACGLAPVISVNGEFHARMTAQKVAEVLDSYRSKVAGNGEVG